MGEHEEGDGDHAAKFYENPHPSPINHVARLVGLCKGDS
jgi:hypothetical protein